MERLAEKAGPTRIHQESFNSSEAKLTFMVKRYLAVMKILPHVLMLSIQHAVTLIC